MTSTLRLDQAASKLCPLSVSSYRASHRTSAGLSSNLQILTQACAHAVHETRNPLTSLRLQIQIFKHQLERSSLLPSIREIWSELLDDMQIEIDRSCARLDDLATLAQLKEENLKLDLRSFDLTDLIQGLVKRQQRLFELKNSALHLIAPFQPITMKSAPDRIEQIINNLLSNAWKYGGKSSVQVKVDLQPKTPSSPPSVQISVIDQGPGVTENEREKIFDAYYRSVHDHSIQGTGLGLMISRKLAHLLGGSLQLLSSSEPGCHFQLQIPTQPQE
jgi:signal transduction histidine kinase